VKETRGVDTASALQAFFTDIIAVLLQSCHRIFNISIFSFLLVVVPDFPIGVQACAEAQKYSQIMKNDEMDGACGMHGRR
jgi:hypothetical protein